MDASTVETEAGELARYEFVYVAEEVAEDLEIVASLEEVSEHPAFADQKNVGGVIVSVSAEEGVLPVGTKLLVEEVGNKEALIEAAQSQIDPSVEETRVSDVIAFDIHLETQDGQKVNFDGDVVEVKFSGSRIRRMTEEADQVQVSYVEVAGDSSKEAIEAAEAHELTADLIKEEDVTGTSLQEVVFEAEHFTTILVTLNENVATEGTWTVNFYESEEAETPSITQTVKNGAETVAPYAPEKEGYEFLGWVEKGDTSKTIVDFGTVEKDLDVYPEYKSLDSVTLCVEYVYSDGARAAESYVATVPKGETLTVVSPDIEGFTPDQNEVTLNEENSRVTVTYTGNPREYMVYYRQQSLDNEQVYEVVGSGIRKNGIAGELTNITMASLPTYTGFVPKPFNNVRIPGGTEEFRIYIDYDREKYLLIYDTDGGSYVAPRSVKYGAAIPRPEENPTKLGFEFDRWDVTDATMPAEQKTVKAIWTEATEAAYTVVYWQEKVPGTYTSDEIQYDFYTVRSGNGTVGTEIGYENQAEKGFSLNEAKTDAEPVRITSDGKAVKNVYFDRNTYTIGFQLNYWNSQGQEINENFGEIRAKYGEDISEQWEEKAREYQWKSGNGKESGKVYSLLKTMPAENIQLYGSLRGQDIDVIYYADGVNGETILKGVEKREDFDDSVGDQHKLAIIDVAQFEGFTFNEDSRPEEYAINYRGISENDSNVVYSKAYPIHYTRNTYEIVFEDCTIEDSSAIAGNKASRKYEAPISAVKPGADKIKPPAEYSDYIFAGWYTSPTYEEEVDWNTTMPTKNLRFFAKWAPPTYTITFHPNNGEVWESSKVSKGTFYDVKNISEPKKANDVFAGWYLDEKFEFPYVNRQITENIHLYAKWKSDDQLTFSIRYVEQNEDGNWVEIDVDQPEDRTVSRGEYVTVDAIEIPGYMAITPMVSARISEKDMTIEIQYKKEKTWSYIVRYVDADGNDLPGTTPETFSTTKRVITVSYKPFANYMLEAGETAQRTVEKPAESNTDPQVIEFRYRKSTVVYTIKYFFDDVEDETAEKEITGKYGHQVTRAEVIAASEDIAASKPGYTFVDARPCPLTLGLEENQIIKVYYRGTAKYVVNHYWENLDGDYELIPGDNAIERNGDIGSVPDITSEWRPLTGDLAGFETGAVTYESSEVGETADAQQIVVDGSLVINLHYDRIKNLSYTVNYLDVNTKEAIPGQEPRQIDNQKFGNVISSEEEKIVIDGYTFDHADQESITIDISDNKINLYYRVDFSKVNVDGFEKIYDAEPTGVTVAGTLSTDTVEYFVGEDKVDNAFTDAGTYMVTVKVTRNGQTRTVDPVKVQVNPATLTVTTPDDEKVYNGEALTKAGTISGFVEKEGVAETATFTTTGSQTLVGTSDNTYSIIWNGTARESNYTVSKELGHLTVTDGTATDPVDPSKVVVKGHDTAKAYELGDTVEFTIRVTNIYAEKKDITITEKAGVRITGESVFEEVEPGATVETTAVYTITKTDVEAGMFTNEAKASFAGGKEFTGTDEVGGLDGTKRSVTYKYTGTVPAGAPEQLPQTAQYVKNEEVRVAAVPCLDGYIFNGWKRGNENVASGSSFSMPAEDVELTGSWSADFSAISVTGAEKTYDAEPTGVTVAGTLSTDTVEYFVGEDKVDNAFTDAGTYKVTVKVTRNGQSHPAGPVLVQVNPATLTVTTPDDEKVYNGEALTKAGTISGFVEKEGVAETATFTTTGSQTLVGTSDNTYSIIWNGTARESNYTVSKELGHLTVTDGAATDPVDPSKVVVKGHDTAKAYELGDTVEFTIRVTNIYAEKKDITITEKAGVRITGESVFEEVEPGATVETTAVYTITKADMEAGKFTNEVKASFAGEKEFTGTDEVTNFDETKYLVVYSYTGNIPDGANEKLPQGTDYLRNEEVTVAEVPTLQGYTFNGWKRGNENVASGSKFIMPAKNVEITGSWSADFDGIRVEGATKIYDGESIGVTVSGILADDVIKYFVDGKEQENAFTDVTDYEVVVTITRNGETYTAEAVHVRIDPAPLTVTTLGDTKVYDGTPLTQTGTITVFVGEGDDQETATLETTGAQVLVGSSTNRYNIVWNGTAKKDNYMIVENLGILTVTDGTPTQPVDPEKVVTKDHEEKQYALGDLIEFDITVTNIYNENKNITIHELEGVQLENSYFANVAPGETVSTVARYTVTEADITNRTFTNTVTASFSGVDKKFEKDDKVKDLDEPERRLTVTKEVTSRAAAADGKYALGETISYKVVVRNTGNQTINGIRITDTKVTLDNASNISLKPGEERVFTYDYQVSEQDILVKNVVNSVTASSNGKEWTTSEITPTVEPSRRIGVKKEVVSITVASGEDHNKEITGAELSEYKAGLGDTIRYRITITNNGNQTLNEMTVKDSKVELKKADATIRNLAPGASKEITYIYHVTEEDIRNGGVINTVIVTDASDTTNEGGDVIKTPTVEADWNMSMTKDVVKIPARGYFRVGEEAVFRIRVTNTGNQTLTRVVINDTLDGAVLKSGNGYTVNADGSATISRLGIGDSVDIEASYTVTRNDLFNRSFRNTAEATSGTVNKSVISDPVPAGAQGSGSGGSGGGGGSSSGTRSPGTGGGPTGGPGTVTIDPEAVPLANLPEMGNDDILALIDDEEVPLAALPKTGQAGSAALMLMISSMMLAAFAVVTRKKEEEQ